MTNLNITERQNGFITILDLEGKIRLGAGCAELHEALRLLVERGKTQILLNMAGVAFIDSSGLGELVGGYNTLQRIGGELKLLHLSDRVHELMTITKLLTVFDVYDDEMEAIANFNILPEKPAITQPLDLGEIKYEAAA